MKSVLEGLLFVVGEDGLSLLELQEILNIGEVEVKKLVKELKQDYESVERGIRINFLGNKFKLTTKEEHKEYYKKLLQNPTTNRLTTPTLETLAIIAYNEPVTRYKIDSLRGVSSIHIVRKLLAKGFIKEVGRSEQPGRPILYETTNDFLDYFGLSSIEELPDINNFINTKDADEEKDLYKSKYREN